MEHPTKPEESVAVERAANGFIIHALDGRRLVVMNDDAESLGRYVMAGLGVAPNIVTPLVRAQERLR